MNPLEIASALDACTTPSPDSEEAVASFSTGSLGLDSILHPYGWPVAVISRISGEVMTGKTTLLYHSIAQAQKAGMTVALVDFHNHFSPDYAAKLGVDLDDLIVTGPSWMAYEIPVELLAVDGISSQFQADLVGGAADGYTVLAVTQQSQWRGVPRSPRIPHTAVSVSLRAGKPVPDGMTVHAFVNKDEFGPAQAFATPRTEFKVRYGTGIDVFDELLTLGVLCGAVQLTGSWYDFGSGHGIQGRENAALVLSTIPALAAGITERVKASWTPAR